MWRSMQEQWDVGLSERTDGEEAEVAAHVEQNSKYKVLGVYLGEEGTEAMKLQLLDSLLLNHRNCVHILITLWYE